MPAAGNLLDAGAILGSHMVSVLSTTVTYYTTGELRFMYGLRESKYVLSLSLSLFGDGAGDDEVSAPTPDCED